jgi:hypothetical protein
MMGSLLLEIPFPDAYVLSMMFSSFDETISILRVLSFVVASGSAVGYTLSYYCFKNQSYIHLIMLANIQTETYIRTWLGVMENWPLSFSPR